MWRTPAEWHAALNHFPPALLLASVGLDIAGALTRRESLRTAGFWTLMLGVLGAAAAIASGLLAERSIEHGAAVHAVMERHETMAISVGILFGVLAGWRLWRRGSVRPAGMGTLPRGGGGGRSRSRLHGPPGRNHRLPVRRWHPQRGHAGGA